MTHNRKSLYIKTDKMLTKHELTSGGEITDPFVLHIEMRVPEIIRPLFDKYRSSDNSDLLFRFAERFSTPDSFCSNVNTGVKQICASMGKTETKDKYCVYTFRHTWATTAQNDCGASLAEIGFAMNHSHGYSVTRGYVKLDFNPAWTLNEEVVDFIFFSDKPSKRSEESRENCSRSRLSTATRFTFISARRVWDFKDRTPLLQSLTLSSRARLFLGGATFFFLRFGSLEEPCLLKIFIDSFLIVVVVDGAKRFFFFFYIYRYIYRYM